MAVFALVLAGEGVARDLERVFLADVELAVCFQVVQDDEITLLQLVPVDSEFVPGGDGENGFLVNLVGQVDLAGALVFDKGGVVDPQKLAGHLVLQYDAVAVHNYLAILGIDHDLVVFGFLDRPFVQ